MAKAIVASVVFMASLAFTQAAVAGNRPPPNPSIAQYVEQVPTSGGSVVPTKPKPTAKRPVHQAQPVLSQTVEQQLPSTPEGTTLRNVASKQEYGAPQHKLHTSKRVVVVARRAVIEPKKDVSGATFGAAIDAVGAQRATVLWLGFALFAIAGLGVGAAVVRVRHWS
jgi:hypothetical protein